MRNRPRESVCTLLIRRSVHLPESAGKIHIISPRFIRDVHHAGCRIQAWTIDDEPDMKRLLAWGIDGLISNRPDVAVRVRDDFVQNARL